MVQPILQMPDRFVNVSHRSKGLSFYKNLPFGWFFKIKRTRKFLPWQWIWMFELWNQYIKKSWRVMLNISNEKLKPVDWMSILQKRQSELKNRDFKRRKNWSKFIFSLHSEKNIHYGSSMMLQGKTPLERHRGIFTASVGTIHLERPLKSCKLKFEGPFHEMPPTEAVKTPRDLSL